MENQKIKLNYSQENKITTSAKNFFDNEINDDYFEFVLVNGKLNNKTKNPEFTFLVQSENVKYQVFIETNKNIESIQTQKIKIIS